MKYISYLSEYLSDIFDINSIYIKLFLCTILAIFVIKFFQRFINYICFKIFKENKIRFILVKKISIFSNLILFVIILLIWENFIVTFITLISFVSAAIAYSLRDTIINFFSGIYIKVCKPFLVEDRIMIDGYIGDVINIGSFSFEILEVSEETFQSTGAIVHIPNSKIFSGSLVNYVKVFKYVWNEIEFKVCVNSDIKKIKGMIYKIVSSNDVLKKIPNKMINKLNNNAEYRIYYNKLEPTIYTSVCDNYVSLKLRYLVHPKKKRNIESDIWKEVLCLYNRGEFPLYIEN